MIRILPVLVVLFLAMPAPAQSYEEVLKDVNDKRIATQKTGMQVLGAWAIGNIALGLTLRGSSTGQAKHFHTMNAGWNVINFGLATIGYLRYNRQSKKRFSLEETVKKSMTLQKVYLLNTGLDVGYMAAGLYLRERANRSDDPDMLRGFGNSIILQGGFLFAYDLLFFYLHSRVLQPALQWMNKLEPTAGVHGIGFRVRF